jgi:hypothetical protein
MPVQESRSISPHAPSPPEEFVATPREEVFPETATQPVPQPQLSYPSSRKMPRWIWVAAGAAIFVLCGSFFFWRKQSPPAVTSSVVESPHVQSTPNITGFTLDIDSVGKSPDGKQMFPKHVRAFINGTAVKLKGDHNHWSVDFGAKMPPLPFDLEVSAPGYQSAVLHFEHVDDLKNPSPLRLDREHGNIAFRPSGTSDFTAAQLKMVEALPGQNEDVVVDSSTLVQDLSATTPIVVPTGVYEVAFQSRNRGNAVKPTVRVAVQAGAIQPVDVPKPLPAVAAKAPPHPATPAASVITTNETSPPTNKLPAPVTVVRQTPAPSAVIPSPAVPKTSPAVAAKGTLHPTNPPVSVTSANETSASANNPPAPVTAARETPAPPAAIPSPAIATAKETQSPANIPPAANTAPMPANVPPTPAYAVKKSPAPENPSPPAVEAPPRRTKERTAKYTERKPKKVSEPPTAKAAARPPPASPKARSTPVRKKATQPFEGGVPGS